MTKKQSRKPSWRDVLIRAVEGHECSCGLEGMTASGVGVCMAPIEDSCTMADADCLLVEGYATAYSLDCPGQVRGCPGPNAEESHCEHHQPLGAIGRHFAERDA